MDYTNLNTYKTQAKYIAKLYNLKRNAIEYNFEIAELRKLKQVYSNLFDAEDSDKIMPDIQILENKAREDQERIKECSTMIEHIEICCICCNSEGTNDTKYLEEKPINAKYWNNLSIQEIEDQYDHLINQQ